MKTRKKFLVCILTLVLLIGTLTGCGIQGFLSGISEFKGSLIGNSYNINFYDNYGAKFLTTKGNKIDMNGNYTTDIDGNNNLSSVVTITIDGKEIETCGSTVIFEGKGLSPSVDFTLNEQISSTGDSITSLTSISKVLNKYKNYFGKKRIVLIQSQLGTPICAYEGDDVYWDIPDDLDKTTKLMIDDVPLYIHRTNFQIIDYDLIN